MTNIYLSIYALHSLPTLPFNMYLLNPHLLEAEGLYCGKLSIFKLDILLIS